ncbi:hypothetical protein TRVL_00829 [Trypanosoma vivax]|nr:hypothetical protein TRVL_00829 [Trypanosoma vivax]
MSVRRESGDAFVRRHGAPRVGLVPSLIHRATEGGLRGGDVLVAGGSIGCGKSQWANRVAALHLSRGGHVTIILMPGTASFSVRRFMGHLEALPQEYSNIVLEATQVEAENSSVGYCCSSSTALVLEARRNRLLEILKRLTVIRCMDVSDLAIYCMHGTPPVSIDGNDGHEVVPLVIVEGCSGKGSYTHHVGRATGREVPLSRLLFGCLQQRWRCALILVEEWGSESTWSGESLGSPLTKRPRPESTAGQKHCVVVASVEEESDLLCHIKSELLTFSVAKPPESHAGVAVDANSFCTTSGPHVPALSTTTTMTTAAPRRPYVMGVLRLFYLYIKSVPLSPTLFTTAAPGNTVSVASLLQWWMSDTTTRESSDNAGTRTTGDAYRPGTCGRPWKTQKFNSREVLRLSGEVLCTVQFRLHDETAVVDT